MAFLKTDLQKYYASTAIRYFGFGLITLFVPAYLYSELGFTLAQVLWYFAVQEVLTAAFLLFIPSFSFRYGVKNAVLASIPFSVLTFLVLPLARDPFFLLLATASRAVYAALYFPAFHVFLARAAQANKSGAATGKTWFWLRSSVVLAPFVGGALLQYAGYWAVFALFVVLQVASVPLLPDLKEKERAVPLRQIIAKVSLKEKFSWFAEGVTIEAGDILWPLYAFIILGSFAIQGAFAVVGGLVSAVFSWWLGHKTDLVKKDLLLKIGWAAGAVTWAYRHFVAGPWMVLLGNVAGDTAFMAQETPLVVKIYEEGKRENDLLSRVVVREIILRLAVIPVLALAFLMPLQAVFLCVGVFFAASAWLYQA